MDSRGRRWGSPQRVRSGRISGCLLLFDGIWLRRLFDGGRAWIRHRHRYPFDRLALDAFIAARPALAPWRDLIWYSAHYSYSNMSARGLAGMLWCIDFRVAACSRSEDAKAKQLLRSG